MTYRELYARTEKQLENRFEAGQLFAHVTAKKAFQLPFLGDQRVPKKQSEMLEHLCRRRKEGEPLQYLLGEWEFYSLPFKVGKGVLIPRADTETLVDVALEVIREIPVPEILDLGSGSGCVAITLQHQRPDSTVTALEISDSALDYLHQNKALNDSPIQIVQGDLWEYTHPRLLDLLVSNPPYIPQETIASLQTEVLHEPVRALDGGKDGLDFYRAIIRRYRTQIAPEGWLCMEIGIGQSEQVQEILRQNGFVDIGSRDDSAGIPRVIYARNPQ